MKGWLRPLFPMLCVLCMAIVCAQAPADPQRAKQEEEAAALLTQGEARMKVASYEEAISSFENLIMRYPDTDARYTAQFRMADALMALKKEPNALQLLQSVVKEGHYDWSPRALVKIGEVYTTQQKFSDAFSAYKTIIADYPDSIMVDYAHFAIGKLHFQLGHFELAAAELDKVGTATASQMPDLQRVSPGEPLYVRMTEPNLVAGADSKLVVTVTTKSGDKESVTIYPEVEGGDRFSAAIPTELGVAKPGDNTLQLFGNDTVTLSYKSRYVGTGAVDRTITMAIASNARLIVRDSVGSEVRGVVMSDTIVIEVQDADRDTTNGPDSITAQVTTKKKDSEKLTLKETGAHTGIFRASIKTTQAAPAADSGVIESSADLAEGSATQLDDAITVIYSDELNLSAKDGGAREVKTLISMITPTDGTTAVVSHDYDDPSTAIKAMLFKGRSLTQIASTYKDLGQGEKGQRTFKQAHEQFQQILAQYPNASEIEEAYYGMYQNYVAQDNYTGAIQVISQILQRFPQSSRAPQALMELASIHVKREEYDRALAIYQNLTQTAKGTALAEEAQYAICTTYLAMLKPGTSISTIVRGPSVTAEQVTFALEEYARIYPTSERTPNAMFELVNFRNQNEDYPGAIATARRMAAMFPDSVMTGRVLMLMAQAQIRTRDFEGAVDTLKKIIANYGNEADQAKVLLEQILRRLGPRN